MAKRISSILSFGSSSSDQTQSSGSSRLSSSIYSARPPREPSPAKLVTKSTPELRPVDNSQVLQDNQPSGLVPPVNPSLLAPIDDGQTVLQSPQLLSPIPIDETSPNGSRRASVSSRPQSRAGNIDALRQQIPTLKPFPNRSESPGGNSTISGGGATGRSAAIRPGSRPPSRPASPIKSRPQTPTKETKLSRRRSWLPGRSKTGVQEDHVVYPSQAWIVMPDENVPYDVSLLANFQKVPELWAEHGDALIYLHAREHGRGPSFKVDSSVFASSRNLTLAAHGATHSTIQHESGDTQHRSSMGHGRHLSVNGPTSPTSSQPGSPAQGGSQGSRSISDFFDDIPVKKDVHLYLSLPLQADLSNPAASPTEEDVEALLTMRNLFAFLAGQPLVATPQSPSFFTILMKISDALKRYEFTNLDGSTLGEEVAGSFAKVVEDYKLADVRSSREKTIEAIILGERMRSSTLYNEGFVHAVGKYDDISRLESSKYGLISDVTRKRLERAYLDLSARLRNIRTRLNDFDFPSLFAGVANSTTSADSKMVHFKDWKSSYISMRRHIISLYKDKYGAWPPKARSKKNDFEESGLNRLLLLEVYQDFSDLYDILVDRKSQTTRSVDLPSQVDTGDSEKPRVRALRRVLDEYDRSTPPVQPPVPFDIPQLPSLSDIRRNFSTLDPKKQKKENAQKLSPDEINQALMQSYNRTSIKATPFLSEFMSYERRAAQNKSIEEMADLRIGQWLFMYAVLESLPLLVVDAPGLKWTKGVEYFLCEVPKGSAPWVQEKPALRQSWYGVAGGAGMVSLPADVVEHGVEGIYRRSHCWQVAEQWTNTFNLNLNLNTHQPQQQLQQLAPPSPALLSPALPPSPGSRSPSPATPGRRRASSVGGLEHLPLPPGVVLDGSRPASIHSHDPSKTFGTILAQTDDGKAKKKK